MIVRNEVDIGIAAFYVTEARAQIVDLSVIFDLAEYEIDFVVQQFYSILPCSNSLLSYLLSVSFLLSLFFLTFLVVCIFFSFFLILQLFSVAKANLSIINQEFFNCYRSNVFKAFFFHYFLQHYVLVLLLLLLCLSLFVSFSFFIFFFFSLFLYIFSIFIYFSLFLFPLPSPIFTIYVASKLYIYFQKQAFYPLS